MTQPSQTPQSASGTAPAHAWRFASPERRHPVTQCERILRHLQDYGSITQAEAVTEYGCYRLGARIWDLRAQGVPIKSETVTGKNRYGERTCFARYSLEHSNEAR
ncbi:MAG: helix-turn-helix domain-containing protein [Firmicutes bacterium]|nr:helix-turn-helix domain-containing protein [Bacillota bacterium]